LQTKDAGVAGWFGRAGLRLNFMGNITMKIAIVSSNFCRLLKGIDLGERRSWTSGEGIGVKQPPFSISLA
jgi:hypothetical protein